MKSPVPECILWTKSLNSDGYGRVFKNGKYRLCHRLAYEEAYGTIPKGLYVLHKCDVRNCINPDHLFLGTQKENMDDMNAKGRGVYLKGESHGMAKLTWERVAVIRKYHQDFPEVTYLQLAHKFGVSNVLISKVIRKLAWV